MSIQYCTTCNMKIDTDYEAEHFCEDCGECIVGVDRCEHCENNIDAHAE